MLQNSERQDSDLDAKDYRYGNFLRILNSYIKDSGVLGAWDDAIVLGNQKEGLIENLQRDLTVTNCCHYCYKCGKRKGQQEEGREEFISSLHLTQK